MSAMYADCLAWLHTEAGARYIARRVIAGATNVLSEQLRLERWLRARNHYNGRIN